VIASTVVSGIVVALLIGFVVVGRRNRKSHLSVSTNDDFWESSEPSTMMAHENVSDASFYAPSASSPYDL
jgi:hypothetical protein